jgi:hypothetical protein
MISGYSMQLGASDFITALINNSANFTTIFSIFSFLIFERLTHRKKTLLTMNFISRSLIFLVIVLPVISHKKGIVTSLLCILVITSDTVWGIYRVGWLVWMIQIIQEKSRSDFIYFRAFLIRIFSAIIAVIAGFILDYYGKSYIGFVIIFSASYILSITDLVILKQIEDVEFCAIRDADSKKSGFFKPVGNPDYRNFILFIVLFYLTYTISTCFTPVFLLKYLKFGYKYVSIANMISMITAIISNKIWSSLENRKGINYVITMTSYLAVCELLILSFLSRNTAFLLIISSVVSGMGMGGFSVSTMTYRYKIMPVSERTLYEGWYYFSSGIGMLLAPFIGKFLLGYLAGFPGVGREWNVFRVLYAISTVAMLVLLVAKHFLSRRKITAAARKLNAATLNS